MTRPSRNGARPEARAGFTLIEILIALMISGLVVSSIFQVLQGNSRFVQMQSSREEVQQNARAALDVIAGDLRAVPPGAIVEMEPNRIRFYQPRAWGVLCNTLTPSSATAWVLFPASVVPADSFYARSNWGLAVEQTGDPLTHTGGFLFVNATTRVTVGDPCGSIQSTTSTQRVRLGFTKPGSPFITGGSVLPGTQVMLFEEMRYDVAASTTAGISGSWIRRMAGYSGGNPNMQPMAGPVPATGALRFTYVRADGVTPAATAAQIRKIGIDVVTQSRAVSNVGGVSTPQQVDSARTDIYLRNIPG